MGKYTAYLTIGINIDLGIVAYYSTVLHTDNPNPPLVALTLAKLEEGSTFFVRMYAECNY